MAEGFEIACDRKGDCRALQTRQLSRCIAHYHIWSRQCLQLVLIPAEPALRKPLLPGSCRVFLVLTSLLQADISTTAPATNTGNAPASGPPLTPGVINRRRLASESE